MPTIKEYQDNIIKGEPEDIAKEWARKNCYIPPNIKFIMAKKKVQSKEKLIELEENYVEFLRKQLNSSNFVANSTKEEYDKQRKKLDKAKFKLRVMKGE